MAIKRNIMKYVSMVISYGLAFLLGLYVSSQFRFNITIPTEKWIITGILFIASLFAKEK
jgi:hypothetical protein